MSTGIRRVGIRTKHATNVAMTPSRILQLPRMVKQKNRLAMHFAEPIARWTMKATPMPVLMAMIILLYMVASTHPIRGATVLCNRTPKNEKEILATGPRQGASRAASARRSVTSRSLSVETVFVAVLSAQATHPSVDQDGRSPRTKLQRFLSSPRIRRIFHQELTGCLSKVLMVTNR